MKLRLPRARAIAVVAVAFVVGLSLIQAAPASAATPSDFVSQINSLRASKGLQTLYVDSRLTAEAQAWANHMASVGGISHNPALGSTPGNWTVVGENVGVGPDVGSLMSAFIASPEHYANLTKASYNAVGVGVAVGGDGRIYTTHDFADYPGQGGSAAAASKPSSHHTTTTSHSSTTSAPKSTSTTAAPTSAQAPAAAAAPPAPPAPAPSALIVQGLTEVGLISAQG